MHGIYLLLDVGFRANEIQSMPLDQFYIHIEGAKRYLVARRKEQFVDTGSAIGAAFTKDGGKKYLRNLDELLE